MIQGPLALSVGVSKKKVKSHGLLEPHVENVSNESFFLSLNFDLIQVTWNCS